MAGGETNIVNRYNQDRKDYHAEWRRNNRDKCNGYKKMYRIRYRLAVDQIKVEAGCVDCGYNDHPAALDFDHLPGVVKTNNVSTLAMKGSWKQVQEEIAKCEVVCANCHRIRTAKRLGRTYEDLRTSS